MTDPHPKEHGVIDQPLRDPALYERFVREWDGTAAGAITWIVPIIRADERRVVLERVTATIEAQRAGYLDAMRASTGGDDSTEAGAALDALGEVLAAVCSLGDTP